MSRGSAANCTGSQITVALQIVGRMAAAAGGADACPLFMYSGHDTTIMPILATLGVQLKDWPEYVSNVVSSPSVIPDLHRPECNDLLASVV